MIGMCAAPDDFTTITGACARAQVLFIGVFPRAQV